MGHLVNPVSYQLGYTRFWLSTWAGGRFSAGLSRTRVLTQHDYKIIQFISQILGRVNRVFLRRSSLSFYNRSARGGGRKATRCFFYKTKLYRSANKVFVVLFLWTNLRLTLSKVMGRLLVPKFTHLRRPTPRKGPTVLLKKRKRLMTSSVVSQKKYTILFRQVSSCSVNTVFLRFWKSILVTRRIQAKNCSIRSTNQKGGGLRRIILTKLIQLAFCNLRFVLERALQKFHVGVVHQVLFNCNRKPTLSASFLVRYIVLILTTTRRPVQRLFQNIGRYLRRLIKKRKLVGFKIMCAGRFARRGRAGLAYQSTGLSSSTNTLHRTDFAFSTVLLTNSICGLKVWLSLPSHSPSALN